MGYNRAKKKMKKNLFVTAALLIGIIAGAMVFSSFKTPNEEKILKCYNDNEWTYVGSYNSIDCFGRGCGPFHIWQKEGMCNSYYWVYGCSSACTPDDYPGCSCSQTSGKGVLRQNSEGKWYCAFNGYNYYIDF